MNKDTPLKVGMQVACIPPHVRQECENNIDSALKHKDTEFGFISSWHDYTVFVRFWRDYFSSEIRTVANSEGCNRNDLEPYNSHADFEVIRAIERFRENPKEYGWYEQKTQ